MSTEELKKTRAATHGGLFIATLITVSAGFPSLVWPWYLVLPMIVYGGIVLLVGPLRRTVPKLAIGRVGGRPLLCAAFVAVATTSILVGFQMVVRPDVKDLATKIPVDWFRNIIFAGVCFSVVNAAIEEMIFRGILWELAWEEWNQATALGVTAVLFGVGHLEGYPPGPIGAVMAGLYGVTLGTLRWWTGGLGLASVCHVGADATIFCILAETGAFDTH
jgi:membrane protease YdiL (CAAX protease family)